MSGLLALGTALVLGFLHALEVDHMVAVSAFVSRRPAVGRALGFGLRWGAGHSISVCVAGAVLLATGIRWSAALISFLEGAVGVALIAVGIWTLGTANKLHSHATHEHAHEHGPTGHGITAVGLLHGLAGTSAVTALIPVTLLPDWRLGLAYLVCFGFGVMGGMAVFAVLAALAMRHAAAWSVGWARRVTVAAGMGSLAVGVWWLVRVARAG